MAEHRGYEDRTKKSYRGVEPMNAAEKAALDRIRESLEEWNGQRYAQHVLSEDLETLLKLINRIEKEQKTWGK